MLKLIIIFLVGIAYAAQTRIKIGSKSWGYQIDLNQGQNQRTEFGDEQGVAVGSYHFTTADNQTKRLTYRIDPNPMEPDISFDVHNFSQPIAMLDSNNSTSNDRQESSNSSSSNSNNTLEEQSPSFGNMTFDSIDSKQDFKGHVTVKVGNLTYTINFVTGDRSHTREETLSPNGMLFGRFTYVHKISPQKVVINYKFNSSSPEPAFEVSLYKTPDMSDTSNVHYQPPSIAAIRDRDSRERDSHYARQLAAYQRGNVAAYNPMSQSASSAGSSGGSGSINGSSSGSGGIGGHTSSSSGSSSGSIDRSPHPYRTPHSPYQTPNEKYRTREHPHPNWYYPNRGKPAYDP